MWRYLFWIILFVITVAENNATSSSTTASSTKLRPKPTQKRSTTISITTTVEPSKKPLSLSNKKKQDKNKTSTTTLSPIEIMNRLYQMHGMASHGVAASHYNSPSSSSSSSTSSNKKKEQEAASSMDDIYRLHALAMAQASHGDKKKTQSSPSISSEPVKESSNTKQNSNSQKHSIEHIYQQHSSSPSSMHHIMAQHSQSSSRPQKTSVQESHSSSLSTIMQPLLKQLTPVGAGLGVVLAPFLLLNGFLTFFSNMSRFLNNFAETILPVRRPTQNPQNYFQNIGPDHLQRQPRDWLVNTENLKDIHEFAQLILKALQEAEG